MSTHDHSTARIRIMTTDDAQAMRLCGDCSTASARDAWAVAAQERFGWCGVRLGHPASPMGAALISPSETGEDSLQIRQIWVHPQWQGQGVGRQLLQTVAAQTRRAGLDTVTGTGSRLVPTCVAPPLMWWLQHGYDVMHTDPKRTDLMHPTVRLDLDRAVTWPWWSTLMDRVRQAVSGWDAPPHPTSRAMRRGTPVLPTEPGKLAHPPIHQLEVPAAR